MAVDLTTQYLGLRLRNPLVASACTLTAELDVLRRLEEYGVAAAVFPSLFEEQFALPAAGRPSGAHAPTQGPAFWESLSYLNELKEYNRGPEAYLKHLEAARRAVAIPIIGSLNVTTPGDWLAHAARIEQAGASALELNIYFLATDMQTTGGEIEARYVELVSKVRDRVKIPLAVKIGPYFTALPSFARRLVEAGADGLVLFNRFMQPDIDLDTLGVVPRVHLSTSDEVRLTLRWIAILHGRLKASLAATGGAHFPDDVIKLVLAGADVVMVASTLYRHGVETVRTLLDGLTYWAEENEYASLDQVRGSLSQRRSPDPAAFERANYTKAIATFLSDETAG